MRKPPFWKHLTLGGRSAARRFRARFASTLHRNDSNPGELILSVVFDSKENYEANASDPGQDEWYQHLRGLLDRDPVWMDGDMLACKHI